MDSRAGRAFDVGVQLVVLVSIAAIAIETLPDLTPRQREILTRLEIFSVSLFTAEYLLRLYVAPRRLRFATSFYGVVDLLAILPFYLSLGLDLRGLRALRLLRLLRILKLGRYSEALQRLAGAFRAARHELLVFLGLIGLLLYVAAFGIYLFEHQGQPEVFASVFHSLWWAVITLTTVGYGDIYPITAGGRLFASLILLIGIGVVAVPTGILSSALTHARVQEARAAEEDAEPDPTETGGDGSIPDSRVL